MYLVPTPAPESQEHGSTTGALLGALARTPGILDRGASLAGQVASAAIGRSSIEPHRGDRRFADPAWVTHPVYRRLGQAYLAVERAIGEAVEDADIDWSTRERARFAAGILASGLAPTNTLLGNPAALKHAFETGGMSLVRGGRNLLGDVRKGRMPRQVDSSPFRVGETVGTSPGQVVFRNEVLEILQFSPTTPTVRAVPLLVVWSVINRHYILDLAKDRSFIEFAVGQGLQVFVTSWRNPTAEHADWDLDTYAQALLEATDAVREITGSEQVGTVGLCAGGQLLSAVMAHLQGAGEDRVAHAAFGVSQIDMSVPNVAGLALHPALHGAARLGTEAAGVVDGRAIAAVFSWLRPTELVWNQWVNNYLLGKDAPQYDILAWNNDTTRVPGALQRDLLRIAVDNLLATPGGLTLLGTPVDLGDITTDTYIVGAETDHLVPWQGAYRSTQLFGGDSTFVLSGGGHIQHLVNPPGNPKAHFRTGPVEGNDAQDWLAGSVQEAGSWWPHWAQWAVARSGEERPAPKKLGSRRHRALEPAPGRYVMER
jgi:polyhydroxyalkanoate synthase